MKKSISTILIPGTVSIIDRGAFNHCYQLSDIILQEGVTKIKSDAFRGCISLTKMELPSTIEKIEMSAFADCTSLTTIVYKGSKEPECNEHALDDTVTTIEVPEDYINQTFCGKQVTGNDQDSDYTTVIVALSIVFMIVCVIVVSVVIAIFYYIFKKKTKEQFPLLSPSKVPKNQESDV